MSRDDKSQIIIGLYLMMFTSYCERRGCRRLLPFRRRPCCNAFESSDSLVPDNTMIGWLMPTRVVRYGGGWTNYVHVGCSLCAAQSHDGELIASSATHGQILIRAAKTGDIKVRLNGHWNSVGWVAWAPGDRTIASACADGTDGYGIQRLALKYFSSFILAL